MIAKRLGAIALTVAMIVGAWLIRSEVIDDEGGVSGDDDPPPTEREIVCVADLRDACNAVANDLDLDIRIEAAGDTLDAFAALTDPSEMPIWVTMSPFPEMVDNLRGLDRLPDVETTQTRVGSSRVALVVLADRTSVLTAACGDPLDWECVGEAAGDSWEDIGGAPSWRAVRPAFAPIDSAIGLIGVADAVAGYFDNGPILVEDSGFLSWGRRLARAVPATAQSSPTAIETIQIRSSALDIAVGPEAELSDASTVELSLQYADPMIRADVVVAVPDGASVPAGLIDDLGRLLVTEGNWDLPSAEPNPLPGAQDLVAIRDAWKRFS